MKLIKKNFYELDLDELYEILQARSKIFVVEQKCIYEDLDNIDKIADHFMLKEKNNLIAYLRVYPLNEKRIQIGRVLTVTHNKGYGRILLEKALNRIKKENQGKEIVLNSQEYAIPFYEKFGFQVAGESFLEDGIPHVKMICKEK